MNLSRFGAGSPRLRRRLTRLAPALSLAALLLSVSACDGVPDEMNPARWFRDEEDKAAAAEASSEEFPNLATVPDQPRPASSPEELEEVTEGLIADRAKAAYTDEFLRNNPGQEVDFSAATASAAVPADTQEAAPPEEAATESIVEAAPAPEVTTEPVPAEEASVEEEAAPAEVIEEVSPPESSAAEPSAEEASASAEATSPAAAGTDSIIDPMVTHIVFGAGSASLDEKAQATLQVVAKLAEEQAGTFRILTWAGGPEGEDAADLAERRAIAVAEGLLALGVSGGRLSALVMKGPDPDAATLEPSTGRATITLRK